MLHFSALHVALVVALVLLLFGPKRLPELARCLGEGLMEFKNAIRAVSAGTDEDTSDNR